MTELSPAVIPPETPPDRPEHRRWGPWASLGFTVGIMAVSTTVAALICVLTLVPASSLHLQSAFLQNFIRSGFFIGLTIVVAAPLGLTLIALCIWFLRGPTFCGYLSLKIPPSFIRQIEHP